MGAHPELADVEFENVQARVRKLRVMMKANRHRAVELGTGDLSEKALGWSTYAGDQISMYDLNPGIPKTLVEFVIRWVANERIQTWSGSGGEPLRAVLFDILEAPISPELLPTNAEGRIAQLTESTIGPFELHDFFLYWFVGHGTRPARILFLAEEAFQGEYSRAGDPQVAAGLLPALLREPVEAGLHGGRAQGGGGGPLPPGRLADAQRRRGALLAGGDRGGLTRRATKKGGAGARPR